MTVGLVLGATGGIGSACVAALAGSVERMVVVGRDPARLDAARAAAGAGAVAVAADLGDAAGRTAIVEAVAAAGAPLRWVVAASGMPLRGALSEIDPAAIAETFQANLVGPVLLLRALADCAWSNPASVVVVGSISATRALARRSIYGASKAGIEHFAMALGAEWAPRGIRVNVVAPGVIATPFLGPDQQRLETWVRERVPSGRTGTAAEVAHVVRYLVLEAPDYIVGARLAIDGGMEATA